MIAMALANDPSLLIADEPTTALDVTVQAQILDLMRDLQQEFGSAIIMITHDLGVVAEMADEILVMYGGKAVEHGTVDQVFYTPAAPVCLGPAHVDAAPRPGAQGASRPDPGQPAFTDQRAVRLRVPPALRVPLGGAWRRLQDQGSWAGRRRRRAPGAVPHPPAATARSSTRPTSSRGSEEDPVSTYDNEADNPEQREDRREGNILGATPGPYDDTEQAEKTAASPPPDPGGCGRQRADPRAGGGGAGSARRAPGRAGGAERRARGRAGVAGGRGQTLRTAFRPMPPPRSSPRRRRPTTPRARLRSTSTRWSSSATPTPAGSSRARPSPARRC